MHSLCNGFAPAYGQLSPVAVKRRFYSRSGCFGFKGDWLTDQTSLRPPFVHSPELSKQEVVVRIARFALPFVTACLVLAACALGQEIVQDSTTPASTAAVPRLIRFRGAVRDEIGKPPGTRLGIVFSLYKDQTGDAPVWQETQTVQLDSTGHYSVLLGATSEAGLPLEIFSAGEARWLGVRPDGHAEQPRTLLLSVAYALKAADSEMLGGKPLSAFVLAGSPYSAPAALIPPASPNSPSGAITPAPNSAAGPLPLAPPACSSITSDGTATANQIAKFTGACNIQNSALFESSGNVGIGNTAPAAKLDVSGTAFIRDLLTANSGVVVNPSGTATTSQGFPSSPMDIEASVFNTGLGRAASYIYRWAAEPTGNNSSNTGATINLMFGVAGAISETGLSINRNGVLTFSPSQTFPGAGTVTSVATGAGLTGGPITTSGTISIPAAGVTNAMLANSTVKVLAGTGLSGGGTVALGGTITLTNSAPGLGGTVTSVGSGTGLTGGPITSSGTLNLDTAFTDARYLQLSGGTLTGALKGTTATFTAGTFSGSVSAAGALLPKTGNATATQGFNSNPFDFQASSFNSASSSAVAQDFRWMAEPAGNNTSTPSASLNLLFGSGGSTPAETGLSIASDGLITFAPGQTFGSGGGGTVTKVDTGAGLTGGPITKAGTISIPAAGVTNSMLANSSINVVAGSGLSGGGSVALGGSVTLTNTASGGTVTTVNTGAGLTGGPITTTGTISIPAAAVANSMLANPSINVIAGSGLSGGGTVPLGGTVTLASNLSGTSDGIAYFSGPASLTSTPAPTDGQVLIGSTGNAPVLGKLTAGQNITITNGPGSVQISATGGSAAVLPFFVTGSQRTGANQALAQNVTKLWGFLLPYSVTTTKITYDITTVDKTANNYDIGIFDSAGNLVLNIGPTPGTSFASSVAFKTLPWTQGSTALSPGRYYLAFTTNCASACAKIAASASFVSFTFNASAGATSGGALPGTITPPADVWIAGTQPTVVIQ